MYSDRRRRRKKARRSGGWKGSRLSCSYDARGRLVQVTTGNVVSLRRKGADGRETEISYQYDLKGRLIQAGSREGAVIEYRYDLNDRLVEEKRPSAVSTAGTGTL